MPPKKQQSKGSKGKTENPPKKGSQKEDAKKGKADQDKKAKEDQEKKAKEEQQKKAKEEQEKKAKEEQEKKAKEQEKSKDQKSCGVAGCGKRGTQKCGACKNAWYCGKDHQREDWKNHKSKCTYVAAKKPAGGHHGHSHDGGDDHGHSHGGVGEDDEEDHGHSHAGGGDHDHSHAHGGGDDHGHSHAHGGGDDEEDDEEGDHHGHSHDGADHDHSHSHGHHDDHEDEHGETNDGEDEEEKEDKKGGGGGGDAKNDATKIVNSFLTSIIKNPKLTKLTDKEITQLLKLGGTKETNSSDFEQQVQDHVIGLIDNKGKREVNPKGEAVMCVSVDDTINYLIKLSTREPDLFQAIQKGSEKAGKKKK